MTASDLRTRLLSQADAAGGWGYRLGQPAHLEPTCLALAALGGDPSPAIKSANDFLEAQRFNDGSFRLVRGRLQAAWPTALVLFQKTACDLPETERTPIAERLLTLEGRVVKADPEVAEMLDIDFELLGWPWAEDTFSWVEPTAWACVALRKAGYGDHSRVQEGLRLLVDRAFDTGGVNYGNRVVLGKPTEPIPGTTAIMAIALQGLMTEPRLDAALGYLRMQADKTTDVDHLSWCIAALACFPDEAANGVAVERALPKLEAALAQEADLPVALSGGPYRTAIALLALQSGSSNPFRIAGVPTLAPRAVLGSTRPVVEDSPANGPKTFTQKISAKVRGFFMDGMSKLKPLPVNSGVHIHKVAAYDDSMLTAMKVQFAHYRTQLAPAGKRVVLKPNLVEYHRDKVINTDPRFVDAVIQLFKDEGAAEVIVAEGPGHWRNVQYLVEESGLGEVLRKHNVRFVDINHDEPIKTLNLGRTTGLEYLYLSQTVLSADLFVSLPKLKTHHWAGATLSLKNLFGTLPGICYGWPKNELHWRGIPNSIVDIACTCTPHFAIVDGIVGMEGDGPLNGTAKLFGAIVMGADLVAVDATCCRLMMLPVDRIPTLVLAEQKRLGRMKESEIPQFGETIASLAQAFAWPPKIEMQLLKEKR